MSVIMNFAIFPTDKGAHVGDYVSKVVSYIKESGVTYQFSPMGTVIETDTVAEALKMIEESHKILEPVSDRIYCVMNMDYHKHKSNLIAGKTESIEKRIGSVN